MNGAIQQHHYGPDADPPRPPLYWTE